MPLFITVPDQTRKVSGHGYKDFGFAASHDYPIIFWIYFDSDIVCFSFYYDGLVYYLVFK